MREDVGARVAGAEPTRQQVDGQRESVHPVKSATRNAEKPPIHR